MLGGHFCKSGFGCIFLQQDCNCKMYGLTFAIINIASKSTYCSGILHTDTSFLDQTHGYRNGYKKFNWTLPRPIFRFFAFHGKSQISSNFQKKRFPFCGTLNYFYNSAADIKLSSLSRMKRRFANDTKFEHIFFARKFRRA